MNKNEASQSPWKYPIMDVNGISVQHVDKIHVLTSKMKQSNSKYTSKSIYIF